jgi:hypothetical protein
MGKLFLLAKQECSRYSEKGPFERRHYCSGEPRGTNFECLLAHGLPCKSFRDAVLPLKPKLKPEWELLLNQGNIGGAANLGETTVLKECQCGTTFKPRSNRQSACPVCSQRARKKRDRERSRKYRRKSPD